MCKNESVPEQKEAAKSVRKGRKTLMKKFDFSKKFGDIDPKYISEAEGEWKEKCLGAIILAQTGGSLCDIDVDLDCFSES